MKMKIKLGYSRQAWEQGSKKPILWDTDKVPHLLISGITGGGKTVLAQLIVNQLLDNKADVSICDFKAGGDWENIVPGYAEFVECDNVLEAYYHEFENIIRSKGKTSRFLLFDEFASYALSKDTKAFKSMMDKVSHIAFMGRSFGFHLIFISQQFNAKVIDTAIREQFGIKIYMGSTISTESATMLFPNSDIDKSRHLPPQCGYISRPETDLEVIQLPYIYNPARLKKLLEHKGAKIYGRLGGAGASP